MIRARKDGVVARVLDAYVAAKVRRAFRGVWLRGAIPADDVPLLVYANHSGFWDGFVLHQLCRAAGRDGYCLMEERQLGRYRFLARLGAFSIRRGDAGSALETLRYATTLLRRPRAVVVVFPEGELRPFGNAPLVLERGVEVLARTSGAWCQPVAMRYAFLEHERPDVLVEAGPPHRPAPLAELAERLETLIENLRHTTALHGFVRVVRGARSAAERWDAVRGLPAAV